MFHFTRVSGKIEMINIFVGLSAKLAYFGLHNYKQSLGAKHIIINLIRDMY